MVFSDGYGRTTVIEPVQAQGNPIGVASSRRELSWCKHLSIEQLPVNAPILHSILCLLEAYKYSDCRHLNRRAARRIMLLEVSTLSYRLLGVQRVV
jgi:hypothetical protein